MTISICFHHNDADGRASGAIARFALGVNLVLIEIDYDDLTIPWETVAKADKVIVTDFSFPLDDMQKLALTREFVWIDHHKSALKEYENVSDAWSGIRDLSEAACVLTWKYFFPQRKVPRAITLIGDRDIWRWAEEDTGAFTEGLHVRDTSAENDTLWVPLLEEEPELFNIILTEGRRLREIRLAEIDRIVKNRGYEVEFEGHRTLAINTPGNGDLGQLGRDLGYEIVYCYYDQIQSEGLMTNVTLFSRKADVSEIAQRFGGGGHVNAAGFSFPRAENPFPEHSSFNWI